MAWWPTIHAYRVVKGGNPPDECEDAFAVWRQKGRGQPARVAVADGATASMLAGMWAETLVQTFCRPPRAGSAAPHFAAARRDWAVKRDTYLQRRQSRDDPPKWYEEEGFRRGAFAAFLGVELTPRGLRRGGYTAQAVGDVCLFHLRDRCLLTAFPLESSSQFGNQPALVAAVPPPKPDEAADADAADAATLLTRRGGWRRGDTFLLASDALAAWLLRAHGDGPAAWAAVTGLTTAAAFEELVLTARRDDGMRNDDVALVRVVV